MKATNNNPQSCFGDNVALKKPLVLVVEDEQMQRIILRASLERNGFAVLEAVDGRVKSYLLVTADAARDARGAGGRPARSRFAQRL